MKQISQLWQNCSRIKQLGGGSQIPNMNNLSSDAILKTPKEEPVILIVNGINKLGINDLQPYVKVLVAQCVQFFEPSRLLRPWDFSGKNAGVGYHFLLREIFLTQELNPHLLHWQVDSVQLRQIAKIAKFYQPLERIMIYKPILKA